MATSSSRCRGSAARVRFDRPEMRRAFRRGFFRLPVNPQLDPPRGKQLKLGLGLAGHDPVADPELPLPDTRSDRCYGVFDASVNHAKSRTHRSPAFNPEISLKVVNNL